MINGYRGGGDVVGESRGLYKPDEWQIVDVEGREGSEGKEQPGSPETASRSPDPLD